MGRPRKHPVKDDRANFDIEHYLGLIKKAESDIFANSKMNELMSLPANSMKSGMNDMTLREYLQLEGGDPAKIQINIVDYLQKRYKKDIEGVTSSNMYQLARRIFLEVRNYKEN